MAPLSLQLPAQAFIETSHRDALHVRRQIRARPLARSKQEVRHWLAERQYVFWEGEVGVEPFITFRQELDAFVDRDSRVLFNVWNTWENDPRAIDLIKLNIWGNPKPMTTLFYSMLLVLSNEKLLYTYDNDDDIVVDKKYLVDDDSDLEEWEGATESEDEERAGPARMVKTVQQLFLEKIFIGNVPYDLREIARSDLLPTKEDDWIEQMMPPAEWLKQISQFTDEELDKETMGAVSNYSTHSYLSRRAMFSHPWVTSIRMTVEKLQEWRMEFWEPWMSQNLAWHRLVPRMVQLFQAILRGEPPVPRLVNSIVAVVRGTQRAFVQGMQASPDLRKIEQLFLADPPPPVVQGGYSLVEIRIWAEGLIAYLETFFQITYSPDFIWGTLLSDPQKKLFAPDDILAPAPEKRSKEFVEALRQITKKGELSNPFAAADSAALFRVLEAVTTATKGVQIVLRDAYSGMMDAIRLSAILRHQRLPRLMLRPILLYRFMKHDFSRKTDPWLWNILDVLDEGQSATHRDPGVQSTTFNPILLTTNWQGKWSVVFSILCPIGSRLWLLEHELFDEAEILLPANSTIDFFFYRVMPNLIRHPYPGKEIDRMIVLYGTLRV